MIVLDTHVLIWFVSSPEKLSKKAKDLIEKKMEKGEILVSSISIWEIYMLVKKERLKLSLGVDEWVRKIETLPFLNFVPVDNKVAAKSVLLPLSLHQDPADRMIIATALVYKAKFITSDKRILNYPYVSAVW